MDKKVTVDIECLDREITGQLTFSSGEYDELEIMEIAEMTMRVIEAWCERRNFVHDNIQDYDVTFN
jgi:hypothetical protein